MIVKHAETGTIEFVFDHPSDEPPHLMGDWDHWRFPGTPMEPAKGKWMRTIPLPPGPHQFKYRVGQRWYNDFFADQYVEDGFGGDNSVVIVEPPPEKPPRPRRKTSTAVRSTRARER